MVSMRFRGAACLRWLAALAAAVSLGTSAVAEVSETSGGAQFSVLHRFRAVEGTGSDPGLTRGSDGYFYGVLGDDGANGKGAVFRIGPNKKVRVLHSFSGPDGHAPVIGLTEGPDGYFWGSTLGGGEHNHGTIFKISRRGELSVVHSFAEYNDRPAGRLVFATDGNLYGISWAKEQLFRVTPDGQFTVVRQFVGDVRGLIQASDGHLYGSECTGGRHFNGAVVRLSLNGDRSVLHSFEQGVDGWCPYEQLTQASDGNLYGSTSNSVFRLALNGDFQLLHRFKSDEGRYPGPLLQAADGDLYGANGDGGPGRQGTVFRLSIDGNMEVLHAFDLKKMGGIPRGTLVQGADGHLYGTARFGGTSRAGRKNGGIVYQLTLP